MYKDFFGFKQPPFPITPNPNFFYLSSEHLEALDHLIYGINNGEGFLLLVGGIGTGKTTISRVLLEKLGDNLKTSLILNPFINELEFLQTILWDFGLIPEDNSKKSLLDQLNDFLLHDVAAKGKRALLIIDEAQNLGLDILEQVRILSNLETNKEKLLQILLIGQEELYFKLQLPELRQLNQRISVRYYLKPLKKKEVAEYIYHRINKGEPAVEIKFSKKAIKRIYKFSGGIPRVINMLCDRALLAAFVQEKTSISPVMVKKAEKSLRGENFDELDKEQEKRGLFKKIFKRKKAREMKNEFNL